MPDSAERTIKSVQRAIDILDLFDEQSHELGVTEIGEALGLHKSTVAGLIYTLEANGYLNQNTATRKYHLGLKLVDRAFALLDQMDLRAVARPHLQDLRDWCDESVNLAVRDGHHVVYIERLSTTRSLGMHARIGYRAPLHSTALGKAILSRCQPAELEQILAGLDLPAVTVKTITDHQRLLAEIELTRERGFALDDEENEQQVRCVASAILDHTGHVAAALSISAPIHRVPIAEVDLYGNRVRETALAVSSSLGYRRPPAGSH